MNISLDNQEGFVSVTPFLDLFHFIQDYFRKANQRSELRLQVNNKLLRIAEESVKNQHIIIYIFFY